MKRNTGKPMLSVIVAAMFALLVAGCASAPYGSADTFQTESVKP